MSNLSKPKFGEFAATIFALSSIGLILTTAEKAAAVPLYPNDFGSNTQVVRLRMERNAPNGQPVTINITRQLGLKQGGVVNTWIGEDSDSLFKYITNGSAINFQSNYGGYSINVPTLEIRDGTRLNTYASGFSRYQDWNLEKLPGGYGDTYLFRWRTDTNTNLCLDIRGFAPGQSLNNEIPGLSYCDGNNANQRIRVIKQGAPAYTPPKPTYTTPSGNSLVNNNAMLPGTSISSNSMCFRLDAQSDGNLVLYNVPARKAIWNSGTNGRSVKHTVFQNDGALVIYDTNNNSIWNTGPRAGATRFTVQDDGNFVMYNSQSQALAATNTNQPCGNVPKPLPNNLPNSVSLANNYFKTQFRTTQWNPNGPDGSNNCGPTSVAMIFKLFGKEPANTSVQSSIDYARRLMGMSGNVYANTTQIMTGLSNAGLRATDRMSNGTWTQLDRDLADGKAVITWGFYAQNWRNQFTGSTGDGNGNDHINTVLGKTPNGKYLVGDPMHRGGVVEMSRDQLAVFFSYGGRGHDGNPYFISVSQ
jgi:Peptidase_C39 like family